MPSYSERRQTILDMFLAGRTIPEVKAAHPELSAPFVARVEGQAHRIKQEKDRKERAQREEKLARDIHDLDNALDRADRQGKRMFAPGAREAKNAKLSAKARANWAKRKALEELL